MKNCNTLLEIQEKNRRRQHEGKKELNLFFVASQSSGVVPLSDETMHSVSEAENSTALARKIPLSACEGALSL